MLELVSRERVLGVREGCAHVDRGGECTVALVEEGQDAAPAARVQLKCGGTELRLTLGRPHLVDPTALEVGDELRPR